MKGLWQHSKNMTQTRKLTALVTWTSFVLPKIPKQVKVKSGTCWYHLNSVSYVTCKNHILKDKLKYIKKNVKTQTVQTLSVHIKTIKWWNKTF